MSLIELKMIDNAAVATLNSGENRFNPEFLDAFLNVLDDVEKVETASVLIVQSAHEKIFSKGMMTFQHEYGKPYTIPIYCWYIEGGDKKILVDTGEMHPIKSEDRQTAIG